MVACLKSFFFFLVSANLLCEAISVSCDQVRSYLSFSLGRLLCASAGGRGGWADVFMCVAAVAIKADASFLL